MSGGDDVLTGPEALTEAARVMFGFRTREETAEFFNHRLARKAIANLEKALAVTRARKQPDEFALAEALEMEVLAEARRAGHDLDRLFNDPHHHSPPGDEITQWIARLWSEE